MQDWKTYCWGDISELKYGKPLKDYRSLVGNVPVYGTNGYIGQTNTPLCNKEGIIVGRKGAYRGIHFSTVPFFVIDTAFFLAPKITNLDIKYCYYQLLTQDINGLDSGSAIPSTSRDDFYRLKINLPPLQEQKAIASILTALDDKIDINLQMNKTLEEMAMALYKHWFVDFGPFQNGNFVESELGLIPKGWEVEKIGNSIETLGGGTPSTTKNEYWENGDILWYSPTDLTREKSLFSFDTAKKITSLGLQKSSTRMFPVNSLLMSSRATIGLLTINSKPACTNQGFITMLPNEKLSVYQLYFWVKQNEDLIISKSNGSTFKEISKSNFRDLDVIIGKDIDSYLKETEDIFNQIKNNIEENQTLKTLRDNLLPKLISGEVRVKDIEQVVEAAL